MSVVVGRSVRDLLASGAPRVPKGIEIGVIAGDRGVGTGRLLPGLPRPNDGIVAVEETRLAQATDTITLHVAHSEMLFSERCTDQIAAFLESGHFRH